MGAVHRGYTQRHGRNKNAAGTGLEGLTIHASHSLVINEGNPLAKPSPATQPGGASVCEAPPTSETTQAPARDRRPLLFGFVAAALLVGFARPLLDLFAFASSSSLYSHIILIPLVAGYLAWLERRRLRNVAEHRARSAAWPFALIGAALLVIHWSLADSGAALAVEDRLAFQIGAFVTLLVAAVSFTFGNGVARRLAFPLGFLFCMVPFPKGVETAIETFLQHGSAEVAFWMFQASPTPVFREDLVFMLPGFRMEVAPECSGIHSSLVLFITSLIAGKLFLHSRWKRALLALFVIPLALVRNGLRVFTIGQLCVQISPDMIDSYIHRQGGPIFFGLSLVPFTLILWLLWRAERSGAGSQQAGHFTSRAHVDLSL